MRGAREALIEHFPGTAPIALAHAERETMRLDTFVVDHGDEVGTYTVVSVSIDGVFAPETVCCHCHIPYAAEKREERPPASAEIGVFVTAEPVSTDGATRLRFRRETDILDAEIVARHAVVYTWNVAWLDRRRQPRPVALEREGVWHRTVPGHGALPADFVAAYTAYRGNDDDNWWAVSAFYDTESYEERLELALILVDAIDQPDAPWVGQLAAGPIEDLLCDDLMARIESDVGRAALWRRLLAGSCWKFEPADLRDRIRRFLGAAEK